MEKSEEKRYDDIYESVDFNDVDRPRKKRKKKHILRKTLIFIATLALLYLFASSSFFAIKNIEVEGNNYFAKDEIINMADAEKGKNLFFGGEVSDIKKRLEPNPYFKEVSVQRKLPGTIVIAVKERTQIAAIIYGSRFVVIDNKGLVLRKSSVEPKITLISGLTVSKLEVGSSVEAEETETLSMTLDLLTAMEKGDIFFKKIDVSHVVIRAYIYDTLVVEGTPKRISKTVKNGSLQKVVNNLFDNGTTHGTISIAETGYMSFSPDF